MDKQSFVSTIRDWLACDAELAELQRRSREIRAKRNEMGAVVMEEMENNNLTLLDTGSAHLRIAHTRRRQPLTRKYLESRLADMFGLGTDAYKAATTNILESRPVKEHKELKAKQTKT